MNQFNKYLVWDCGFANIQNNNKNVFRHGRVSFFYMHSLTFVMKDNPLTFMYI